MERAPLALGADRVHLELESAFTTEGRHFILEGGNLLALRRPDGQTVVLVGHNARTSADAIDELAYRLLRDDGRRLQGRVASVIVVDQPDAGADALHLDTRVLVLRDGEIAADRALVQAAAGMPARFFVFRRDDDGAPKKPRRKRAAGDEFHAAPKVELVRAVTFEDALARAGLDAKVRWIPGAAAFERGEARGDAPDGAAWIALQQSLWAHALNLLTVAPGVLVGLDRHAAFYRDELGAECVDVEREVLAGRFGALRCCALLAALRKRGRGRPVVLTLRGDEISRARGGARSLVMPLVREREDG